MGIETLPVQSGEATFVAVRAGVRVMVPPSLFISLHPSSQPSERTRLLILSGKDRTKAWPQLAATSLCHQSSVSVEREE